MKLNNKGFAITGFLYSIFAIFLVILSMLIISMTSSKLTLDKVKKNVKTSLDDIESSGGSFEQAFSYTGGEQAFNVPYTGWYLIELWGAEGGAANSALSGNGAYVSGKTYLSKNEVIYVYVGGKGGTNGYGGYNGGGNSGALASNNFGGGGATDIRITNGAWNNSSSLSSRIMVAGGGGGARIDSLTYAGSIGGGLIGGRADNDTEGMQGNGGTQTSGGLRGITTRSPGTDGVFGIGGQGGASISNPTTNSGAGAGGGYYGGGGGEGCVGPCGAAGGGGSSFISGYAGVNAITSQTSLTPTNNTFHYSNKYFVNGVMQSGINDGNGKAKITYLSEVQPLVKNSKLNNVRYIKDCANANSASVATHWVELQAIVNGFNVAKGKGVSGTSVYNASFLPYSAITDGDITSSNYARASVDSSLQCITVDLGQSYNLDEIAVWHYWADGRTYNSNTTYVSSDNYNWTTVKNTKEAETANGKRISAYEYSDVDVTTNNIIYNNLVTNGSFENGTTDWAFSTNVTNSTLFAKYGTNSVRNYHGVAWSAAYRTSVSYPIAAFSNHIYYTSGWSYTVNKGNGSCLNYYNIIYDNAEHWVNYQTQNNLNTWEKGSAIFTIPNVYNPKLGFALADTDSSNALQECYADGALLVDLTATFGAGNEPTKEWCDANLNYVDTTGYTKLYQN